MENFKLKGGRYMRKIRFQIVNIIGFGGMIIVNFLANYLPINGKTTGELSAQYPNLFVPAALTFAIWGVIYLLLAFFVIFQAKDLFKKSKDMNIYFINDIGWLFFVSSLANMAWIFAWHYEKVILSLIIMIILLFSLIKIYLNLNIGREKVTKKIKYLVHLPFSVYLGWITVATIANVTAVLVHLGWNGFGISEVFWTVLVIAVATIITLVILSTRGDIFYSLVIIWAFLGIVIKRLSFKPVYYTIVIAAIVGMIIILGAIINRIRNFNN